MSGEWEQYRERNLAERPETFDAYVDVWIENPDARRQFSGWAMFSQCAKAEPQKRSDMPARVAQAEELMRASSYEVGPSTRRGARRWRCAT